MDENQFFIHKINFLEFTNKTCLLGESIHEY